MTVANVVRLAVYTTDVDELFAHWACIQDRFGSSDGGLANSVLGATRRRWSTGQRAPGTAPVRISPIARHTE
jgi:hypothetical protein